MKRKEMISMMCSWERDQLLKIVDKLVNVYHLTKYYEDYAGKTWGLSNWLDTTHVEEAGRYICDDAGGIDNMQKYHSFEILFKHKQLEKEALEESNKVLLIDTDSLITLYYYELGFGMNEEEDIAFKNVAEGISKLNNYDLYVFLEPDVAWVQDGTRTYGEQEVREANNAKLKKLFDENGINYVCVSGDYETRYNKVRDMVMELIK